MKDTPPPRHPITCESDGKTHKGTYWVAGKILTSCHGEDLPGDPVGALVRLAVVLAGDRMAGWRGVFHGAIMADCGGQG